MSKHVIYDIGAEFLCKTCFGHNSTQNERTSTIFGRIFTEFCVDCESAIKTRFRALWDFFSKFCMRPWIRSLSNILPKRPLRDDFLAQNTILSAQKAPAGRFSGSKYNFVCPKGPCGTTFWPSKYQKICFLVSFSALIYAIWSFSLWTIVWA